MTVKVMIKEMITVKLATYDGEKWDKYLQLYNQSTTHDAMYLRKYT